MKELFLQISQNSQEKNYMPVFFLSCRPQVTFLNQRFLAQVFSYEFCGIFKNTFFTEYLRWMLFVNMLSFGLSSVTSAVSVTTLSMYLFAGKGMNNH